MNRKLFTMLAVGFTVCSAGPVWAVYNPLVIGGTVAAPVTMTPQGFSSTTVSVANETHVEDAPDATNMSTWGGMQMINPDIESYAGTDTHNSFTVANYSGTDTYAVDDQDVATLADSAGS